MRPEKYYLGILEGLMASHECRFDRLGRCVNFTRSLGLAQRRAGMFQPANIMRTIYKTPGPIPSLAEVKLAFLEAVQMIHVGT